MGLSEGLILLWIFIAISGFRKSLGGGICFARSTDDRLTIDWRSEDFPWCAFFEIAFSLSFCTAWAIFVSFSVVRLFFNRQAIPHYYSRKVRPLVRWLVGPLVGWSVRDRQTIVWRSAKWLWRNEFDSNLEKSEIALEFIAKWAFLKGWFCYEFS